MGGKWYQFCGMTGRFKFLHVVLQKNENFTRSWGRARTWMEEVPD